MAELGVEPIDIVVCNLYPFKQTILKEGVSHAEIIENIDIGGPTMIRAAAKNYKFVTVITDPEDYRLVIDELKTTEIRQPKPKKCWQRKYLSTPPTTML